MSKNKFLQHTSSKNNQKLELNDLIGGNKQQFVETKWLDTSIIDTEEQVRIEFDDEAINELALSMLGKKQITPALVVKKDNRYLLIAGERRLRAAIINQEPLLSVIQNHDLNIDDKTVLQLVENIARKDLSAVELAKSFLRLKKNGLETKTIAEKIGKSSSYVSKHLKLNEADDSLIALYNEGTIKNIEIINILTDLKDEGVDIQHFIETAKNGDLTRQQLEEFRRNLKAENDISTFNANESTNETEHHLTNSIESTNEEHLFEKNDVQINGDIDSQNAEESEILDGGTYKENNSEKIEQHNPQFESNEQSNLTSTEANHTQEEDAEPQKVIITLKDSTQYVLLKFENNEFICTPVNPDETSFTLNVPLDDVLSLKITN